ncbi:transporter substrate-binding domain-containing protein [Cumulibacter soli]|uniref:transporter substrate-binding domain-containing protein n=1 Tax=Cumulibacter soli TaxID=2546344 RepID=UPI001067F86E|nr:transporter substrate-binding domain-containing protein [Cumulibacter soli]
MAELAQAGSIRIGVKTDVPDLGYRTSGAADPIGFDVEIAKLVAAELGITEENIDWVSMTTSGRVESLLEDDVDLVIASFSITPQRSDKVGQAGPYYLTGQQLMIRNDEDDILDVDDMAGKSVCSVEGSTSNEAIVAKGANTVEYDSYALCIEALLDGDLDAVSTDGAILAGFIKMYPDELRITGLPFTSERYGIGYKLGDQAMCNFLREVLLQSYDDGSWKAAYESTLGADGIEAPIPPMPDECPPN